VGIVWKELNPSGSGNEKISSGKFEAYDSTYYYTMVECGFTPKYIAVYTRGASINICSIYDETLSKSKVYYSHKNGSELIIDDNMSMSSAEKEGCIIGTTDSGFKVRNVNTSSDKTMYYFAIG